MLTRTAVPLAPLTTLGLGGPAARLVTAYDEAEVVDAVRSPSRRRAAARARRRQQPAWSATRASTAPSCGSRTRGAGADAGDGGGVWLDRGGRGGLGRRRRARVAEGWPGSRRCPASRAWSARRRSRTSARTARRSPQTIAPVRALGPAARRSVRTFAAADCGFGYRTSGFKADPGRYVVLGGDLPAAPRRALARRSATPSWPAPSASRSASRAPLADVRDAVLALRRRKGMVARPRRPRHLERRLVLHQPGARPTASGARPLPADAPRCPPARTARGQDAAPPG